MTEQLNTIVIPYMPRGCYKAFHAAHKRWSHLTAHRRSGKTTAMLAEGVARALEGPAAGRIFYVAPYLSQSKAIAWDILRGLTREVTTKSSEVELWVDLVNGSRVRLFGADRADSLRGLACHGLLADEYADWSPTVFEEVLLPMLADTQGWAVFGGTPKGRNHFHALRDSALADPEWHTELLPADVTKLISLDELNSIQATMSPEVFAQEFGCSFIAPRSGSYYGSQIEEARTDGRIGDFPYEPGQPVEMAADIGFTDSTACWYWQTSPDGYRIIDYDEAHGRKLSDWIALWRAKGYTYKQLWLPHDAVAKTLQTGRSTVEQVLESKLPCLITPNLAVQHGIDAVRMQLPRWYFHHQNTAQGINRLANYRRQYSQRTGSYSQSPLHDENSDGADAARYMALTQREHVPTGLPEAPAASSTHYAFTLNALFQDRESRRPGGAHGIDR